MPTSPELSIQLGSRYSDNKIGIITMEMDIRFSVDTASGRTTLKWTAKHLGECVLCSEWPLHWTLN